MSTPTSPSSALLLHNHASPGDVLVMTGVVRDLALAHPGRFNVTVDSHFPDL